MSDLIQLTPEELQKIWVDIEPHFSKKQKEVIEVLKARLTSRKDCALSQFLIGEEVAVSGLGENFKPVTAFLLSKITPMESGINAVQALGKVVDAGNALGIFALCPPPLAHIEKREPSPFREERMPLLSVAPQMRALLAEHKEFTWQMPKVPYVPEEFIDKDGKKKIRKRRRKAGEPLILLQNARAKDAIALGRVLLSGIVHGGLLHFSFLDRLVFMLLNNEPILQSSGGRLYVEFSLAFRQHEDAEFRRWFVDPLTAVLLMDLTQEQVARAVNHQYDKKMPVKDRRDTLTYCIDRFIHHATDSIDQPPSIYQLFVATHLDFTTRMPIVLANYASRDFVSHSLKPNVWRRINGERVSHVPHLIRQANDDETGELPGAIDITGDVIDQVEIEPRWLSVLRIAFDGTDRDQVKMRITDLLEQKAIGFEDKEAGELFAQFVLWLIASTRDQKLRLALATIKDYSISVSKRVGGLLGMNRIDDLDAVGWAAIFEEVLADANTKGVRTKLVRVLREFLRFLQEEKKIDTGEAGEVLGPPGGLVPVDANILTEAEYQLVRAQLVPGSSNSLAEQLVTPAQKERRTIKCLMFTLAYRCGLRRSEVLMLDLADLLLEHPAEILIRPTSSRTLKTPSATRKIPVYAFLKPEELTDVKEWLAYRKTQEAAGQFSRHLFASKATNQSHIPEDKLLEELHALMREVTGDISIRFHHLRHSFASHMNTTLMASHMGKPNPLYALLPKSETEMAQCVAMRERLYRNKNMTRRDLWALATLLGHSGPDVSLEHYIHTFDLGLAWYLDRPDVAPKASAVIKASGWERTTAYRHQGAMRMHGWANHLWEKANQEIHKSNPIVVEGAPKAQSQTVNIGLTMAGVENIWGYLYLNQTQSKSAYQLVNQRKEDAPKVERLIHNALYLRSITLSAKSRTPRHRFMEDPLQLGDDGSPKGWLACPVKPTGKNDKNALEKLLTNIVQVMQLEPELSLSVLRYFAHNAHPRLSGIHFENPDEPQHAINCLRWLKKLGLTNEELRIESYDFKSSRSQSLSQWQESLGPDAPEIKVTKPSIGRKDWSPPWLCITPIFQGENVRIKKTKIRKETPGKFKGPSPAFRYLMLMAYIAQN